MFEQNKSHILEKNSSQLYEMLDILDYENKYFRKFCAFFDENNMYYTVSDDSYTDLEFMNFNNELNNLNFLTKFSYLIKLSKII